MSVDSDIDVLLKGVKVVMGELGASVGAVAAGACSYFEGSFCDHKKVGF